MFKTYDSNGNETTFLKNHLLESSTIQTQSIITAEWNLNTFENIEEIGNYRYRPNENASDFYTLPLTFTKETSYSASAKYYGATDADTVIDGGYDQNEVQLFITQPNLRNKFYYSLENCFDRFRPRSGINKAVFPGDSKLTKFGHFLTENLAQRPRYYVANKNDIFKYWTSYRTEVVNNKSVVRGYSKESAGGSNGYYIEDAVPFVVYKNPIACNRIIVKMQTHVGEPTNPVTPNDPFTGDASVPKKWDIDILDSTNNWSTAITLDNYTIRKDGYVELVYGTVIPTNYQEIFVHAGSYSDVNSLPVESINGYSYLIGSTYHIWLDSASSYDTFSATPVWQTTESVIERVKPYVTNLVATSSTTNAYATIKGIRLSVETMKKQNTTFDLIEISPRLAADLTDKTIGFSIDKKAGDLATTGIPSGDILASTGSISIFDYDQAFDKGNNNSIIQDISFKNLQFKLYQKIIDVSGIDYIIPLKTMYVDGFPETNYAERTIDISLRDLFFYFESITCPPLFLRNKSLKYIICLLMDAIGFSNYDFRYIVNEKDTTIPNFYVGPDKSLAEVLQDLARSTQSSIFFDENNNLILLSKRYMMPESSSIRETDLVLAGSPDQIQQNVYDNLKKENSQISNIIQLEAENHDIYNAGKIVFSNKYIQKNVEDLDQVGRLDYEKTYTYQPVLLWELSSVNSSESLETKSSNSEAYTLSAVPLNTNLLGQAPSIENGVVVNNIINVGEMVYWLNNYSGYLMANGEIIKYDAKEYRVAGISGSVWIANESDRQYYFSKVPYGGQMQPTGNIRIHTEVAYDSDGNITEIIRHGRGQFGTNIIAHSAGLDDSWRTSIAGAAMDFEYLTGKKKFSEAGTLYNPGLVPITTNNISSEINLPAGKGIASTSVGQTGFYEDSNTYAKINGIIGNYLSSAYVSNIEYKTSTQNIMGAVQSSALIFTGTSVYDRATPLNFISYSYKTLNTVPNKVGTRIRIMGQQTTNKNMSQMPFGEMTYLASQQLEANNAAQTLNISGASGGIAVHVNPKNNAGYYFEIAALSSYQTTNDANVWFYKLTRKEYPNFVSDTDFIAGNNPDNPNVLVSTTNGGIWDDVRVRTSNAAVLENGISIGDRIVVQTSTAYQKGYFKVVDKGSASTPWKLERDELAIPKVLFQAKSDILVDYTTLVGSSRITPAVDVPIYDLRVETIKGENGTLIFYLYINDALIGIAKDTDSDAQNKTSSTIALFGRGTSKCMFEHVYGISEDTVLENIPKVYGMGEITTSNYFKKYRLSEPMIINYLSNIKNSGPQSKIFYDEFGTILRECAYFNIRYDKAYPALLAQVANTYNPFVGYYVSNFTPTPYGAEFMLFNTTDAPLIMNSSTGNYLRINGITFTAESNEELSVDEYFDLINDYSQYSSSGLPKNTSNVQNDLLLIKNSRNIYGKKEFSIESPYIQGRDMANEMMGWMIQKIKKPKLAVSVDAFGLPIVQLGDIVEIDYQSNNNVDIPRSSRFVVYCINHSANDSDISQKIYLSEVS